MKGRASELVDLGAGRLLRRGGAPEREARLMEHARAHGYPVPLIYEVHADALVLERIDGPTMLEDMVLQPWRLATHMRALAALHEQLHRIDHPDGGALLHLDLHPDNVLLSRGGPVVIDWTNAQAGDAALDPALAWLILTTSGGVLGKLGARIFARRIDVRRGLLDACAYRLDDPNVTPAERRRVRRLQTEIARAA
jgi:aminoglycoside phosphotransferase (APT) family kinase protein